MESMRSSPAVFTSSYLADYFPPPNVIAAQLPALNSFSTTTWYLTMNGTVRPCASDVDTCNFTYPGLSIPDEYNREVQRQTDAIAQPLLFSNSGNMVACFRAIMARPTGVDEFASYLGLRAATYGYSGIQLDLEPSCWASNASECEWPIAQDRHDYIALLNATADALREQADADLYVAVGNYPLSQCTAAQAASCDSAGGDAYATYCKAGSWDVDLCNCCAFYRGWFDLDALCRHSRVTTIVNMDTYQDAPFNRNAFLNAIDWYTSHGCPPSRTSIGLLATEASDAPNATEILSLILNLSSITGLEAPTRLDFWNNLWTAQSLEVWAEPLVRYREAASHDAKPLLPAWAWYAISSTVSTAVGLAIFFTVLRRRRTSKRKASREPLMPAAAREDEE